MRDELGGAQLAVWVARLERFVGALDALDGESPTDFCESAVDGWQTTVMSDPPRKASPAMALALRALNSLVQLMAAVAMDWADTPDVRDRFTRRTAQQRAREVLDEALLVGRDWAAAGMPSKTDVEQQIAGILAEIGRAKNLIEAKNIELEAQDAEAEPEQYGALLLSHDASRDPSLLLEKISVLDEDTDTRYREAHERLRRMIDSELLRHISDESDRFSEHLIAVLIDPRDNRIGMFDEDAWDEHRRKLRSALISFTAALYSHREQTVRAAKKAFGRGSEAQAVEALFDDLRISSFDYGWLEEMRGALQHGDINAFSWGFGASMQGEPTANVYMSREFMLDFTRQSSQKKWLKRRELQRMSSDSSVLDMIKAIQPLMGPLQAKLDRILYPHVDDDVATLRELLAQYPGVQGLYALQSGPGFTRTKLWPSMTPLAPRVLAFAAGYEPSSDDDDDDDERGAPQPP